MCLVDLGLYDLGRGGPPEQLLQVRPGDASGQEFPPLFARANRLAHGWLFTGPRPGENGNQWVIDVAPMLNDGSFQQVLSRHNVTVPANLTVPLTVSMPSSRPSSLRCSHPSFPRDEERAPHSPERQSRLPSRR